MRNFIAIIDREHLENSLFLTTLAKSLAKHDNRKGIIIHGDSEYTERIIQTGVMREEAEIRATKDLNRRLIGLFADHGISTIGVHGYQRELIFRKSNELKLDLHQLQSFPDEPALLISSLADDNGKTTFIPLPHLAELFFNSMDETDIVLFSKNDKDEILGFEEKNSLSWDELDADFQQTKLPNEFNNFHLPVLLTTATDFENWPNLRNSVKIGAFS